MQVLDLSFFNIFQLIIFLFKCWLFYGKGCLIISYYYLNNVLPKEYASGHFSRLEIFELKFVDPLANLLCINALNNQLWMILNNLSGKHNLINTIVSDIQRFNYELYQSVGHNQVKSPYFLNFALNYFCQIDNQQVFKNYKLTNRFMNWFNLEYFQVNDKMINYRVRKRSNPRSNIFDENSPHQNSRGYQTPPHHHSPHTLSPSSIHSLSPQINPTKIDRSISDNFRLDQHLRERAVVEVKEQQLNDREKSLGQRERIVNEVQRELETPNRSRSNSGSSNFMGPSIDQVLKNPALSSKSSSSFNSPNPQQPVMGLSNPSIVRSRRGSMDLPYPVN
ncbi:hypothetical protein CLIB1444_01S05490 [[Candida] jaroonii]|uniref:Uncharacterized protein n=1 Tax=[Candida] jaroonii TaxID=467808 RepID=A0ACA9Y0C8_9ASCO|nr:hypothetical protein CLIB1444_01S05490 [[Candida] jaroonii]